MKLQGIAALAWAFVLAGMVIAIGAVVIRSQDPGLSNACGMLAAVLIGVPGAWIWWNAQPLERAETERRRVAAARRAVEDRAREEQAARELDGCFDLFALGLRGAGCVLVLATFGGLAWGVSQLTSCVGERWRAENEADAADVARDVCGPAIADLEARVDALEDQLANERAERELLEYRVDDLESH